MILTGTAIQRAVCAGDIVIAPFHDEQVTTNSYDLTLGSRFIRYTDQLLDPAVDNAFEQFEVEAGVIRMVQGDFLLGHSEEVIGSDHYVPIIHAKSDIARLGVFVHVTADLIDIGFHGQVTFQLHSALPVSLYPGMLVAQVSFWRPFGEITLYKGKYQESRGPQPSRAFYQFKSGTVEK